jgi:hypothetical protein
MPPPKLRSIEDNPETHQDTAGSDHAPITATLDL